MLPMQPRCKPTQRVINLPRESVSAGAQTGVGNASQRFCAAVDGVDCAVLDGSVEGVSAGGSGARQEAQIHPISLGIIGVDHDGDYLRSDVRRRVGPQIVAMKQVALPLRGDSIRTLVVDDQIPIQMHASKVRLYGPAIQLQPISLLCLTNVITDGNSADQAYNAAPYRPNDRVCLFCDHG